MLRFPSDLPLWRPAQPGPRKPWIWQVGWVLAWVQLVGQLLTLGPMRVKALPLGAAMLLPLVLAACLLAWPAQPAKAQGVELGTLQLHKGDAELTLEYSARLTLSPAVDEALQRGVPMYFVAQASLWRARWYWRDDRLAQVRRTWRVAYQPLTNSWRVSLGGLSQPYPNLAEALASMSRVSGWQIIETSKLVPGDRYYVEFGLRLDSKQLPLPMQIDVGNDYQLGVERTLRLD